MALGKPNIDTPRALELRVIAQAIGNIRQRIEAIEGQASITAAQAGETTLRAGQQNISISALRAQIVALAAQVSALAATDTELETFRAGSAITIGTAVYPSDDGVVSQVDPGDPLKTYAVLGVATQTVVEGANVVVRKAGVMQIPDAVFEAGGPVYVGVAGLTQFPDYINLAIPVGVATSTDEMDVQPGWPALQYPGVYSEYETFLPPTWGLVRDAVTLAQDFNAAGNGIVVKTGPDDVTTRTLTGVSNRTTVANGDGVAGNPTVDISASYVGQASITTLGTVGTGTWQGTPVAANFGGTGVANNVASTITISGAFASTFTMTGTTGVTFPTSGTLATTAQLPVGANPSASIGLTAVNGLATTFMRSDAAPALGVGISPTWTGNHTFTPASGNTAVMAGSFGIGVATPTAKLHVNLNTSPGSISSVSSAVLHLSGADATGATLVFDSFASAPGLIGRRAQGTAAAKSAIQTNQNILILDGYGYGTTGYSSTARGGYRVLAAEAWSDSAQGVYVAIYTTPIGSTALAERVRITDVGNLRVVSDNQEVQIGAGQDLRLYHDGTDSVIENDTGNLLIKSGGDLHLSEGQFALQTVGKGISIKEGTNAKQGLTGNLVAGVLVVTNTAVTANSRIQLTRETAGGTLGHISYVKTAGTSFTITSTSILETSTFVYSIFEPS